MRGIWITGGLILLCIGSLVFGSNHYYANIEETRSEAHKHYTEDLENEGLAEDKINKERQSISESQQKKLKEAQKTIQKVYDDSKHQSSELKGVLQDLTPLIEQKDK